MGSNRYVACDFGAESGRVILGSLSENRLKLEEIHRFSNRQVRMLGHLYWDLPALFAELKEGLARIASSGIREVDGIGVDTWGVDFALLDRSGQILANPVSYRDSRTGGMPEAAFARMPRKEIYRITGIQFLQLNTVYQLLSLSLAQAPQLRFADRLLFMPDLFNYLMTGEKTSEYTIASTSQLLDAGSGTWSQPLCDALGLPSRILPEIREPGSVLGPLLPEVAQDAGLHRAVVIAPACHDTACAVAAVPARGRDWAYLSSGTWSLLGLELEAPIISEASMEGNFTNEGGFSRTIRFLRNNMGMWILEGCRRAWAGRGEKPSYDDLLAEAEQSAPFLSTIDPDDARFLNPSDMTAAIAGFCRETNQPVPQDRGSTTRVILESLALKYRFIFDRMTALRGRPIQRLHVVGGGSRNRLLNRFTADALGIEVVAGPVEATAAGNILIQAVATGALSGLEEARSLVAASFGPESYEPFRSDRWEERYVQVRRWFR